MSLFDELQEEVAKRNILQKKRAQIKALRKQAKEAFEAQFLLDSSNEVIMNVNTARKGILVLADIDYPGWRATINDIPTKIYKANYITRAIVVPEGEHQVKFFFHPDSFFIGITVSMITLLICLGILFYRKDGTCLVLSLNNNS